jgi:peptidoglycan/xylan/chitin deacetylase (PgdA/CDA1 family)
VRALSIGYHEVLEGGTAGLPPAMLLYALDRGDFRQHLRAIQQQLQRPVETIARLRTWQRRGPVFLTFDDGGAGAHSCVADELERYGWRAHFFITTDWIGTSRFMNEGQIRELHARGHVIGSHSCSHPSRMSRLSSSELLKEWTESCARLSDIVGECVTIASLPDGYYSRSVGQAAAAAGIDALFTSEPTAEVGKVGGCLVLGRYMILRRMPPSASGAIAAGRVLPRWRQMGAWQTKKAIKAIAGEHYLSIRKSLLKRGFGRSTSQQR